MDVNSNINPSRGEDSSDEAEIYRRLLTSTTNPRNGVREEVLTTPLMTLAVKNAMEETAKENLDDIKFPLVEKTLQQYAVLGFHIGEHSEISKDEPILMNVDAPNSAFVCGSQGSGKSYTLNCMLENCLIVDSRIGQVHTPVAGVAFHYDPECAVTAAETAHLCSMGILVNVLVSRTNEHASRVAYSKLQGAGQYLTIRPLVFRSSDLSVERMHRLMAFADKGSSMPLYMSIALKVLREMVIEAEGDAFDYKVFKNALEKENLTKEQSGPLNLRLELLESFLDLTKPESGGSWKSLFDLKPGTLTIIDLTDPFIDPATACLLFDICLGLVKQHRPACGLVVALDEAHKYMTGSLAASNLTERLLGTVREQRHNATRVIVATQEPTISEKLLDLCTVTIVHRFTSPSWFTAIRNHLGAASRLTSSASEQDDLFKQIMSLGVGESLVFAPSAHLRLARMRKVSKLGSEAINMRTRARIGKDAGQSALTSSQSASCLEGRGGRLPPLMRDDHVSTSKNATAMHDSSAQELVANRQIRIESEHADEQLGAREELPTLTGARSQLVLMCCSCDKVVLVGFGTQYIPEFSAADRHNVRAGVAYATCVQCHLHEVGETKKALKQFDVLQGKHFRNGRVAVDHNLRNDLIDGLGRILGTDIIVLRHDGHLSYLFSRVVQRSIGDRDSLWSVHIGRDGNDRLEANLSLHRDGVFFKSALKPKESPG